MVCTCIGISGGTGLAAGWGMASWRAAGAAGRAGMSMSGSSLIPKHVGHVAAPCKTFSVEKWNKVC